MELPHACNDVENASVVLFFRDLITKILTKKGKTKLVLFVVIQ